MRQAKVVQLLQQASCSEAGASETGETPAEKAPRRRGGRRTGAEGGESRAATEGKRRGRDRQRKKQEEQAFSVEAVADWKVSKEGVVRLQIRWTGYGREDDTWEPLESLDAPPRSYPWLCAIPACVPQ